MCAAMDQLKVLSECFTERCVCKNCPLQMETRLCTAVTAGAPSARTAHGHAGALGMGSGRNTSHLQTGPRICLLSVFFLLRVLFHPCLGLRSRREAAGQAACPSTATCHKRKTMQLRVAKDGRRLKTNSSLLARASWAAGSHRPRRCCALQVQEAAAQAPLDERCWHLEAAVQAVAAVVQAHLRQKQQQRQRGRRRPRCLALVSQRAAGAAQPLALRLAP